MEMTQEPEETPEIQEVDPEPEPTPEPEFVPTRATHRECGVTTKISASFSITGSDSLYCMHHGRRYPVSAFELR